MIIPLVLLIGALLLPAQYSDTYLGELPFKYQRLQETKGKRIVLVGGSNLAFGVDSNLIKENFHDYDVVNMGMYAALGTEVMFDLSIGDIREGDIIIVSPEQQRQTLSDYFNAEYMWMGIDGHWNLWNSLDSTDKKKMIGQLPYFAVDKYKYFFKNNAPKPDGVYARSSFNEYGDIIYADCKSNIMNQQYDTNTLIEFEEDIVSDEFISELNEFVERAIDKGATVWYRFCPMNILAVENGNIDNYYEMLQEKIRCPIIGNPNKCIMDAEWFYDTNFHLNASGKIVNTRQLIRDMKAMLGDSSKTNINLPDKPQVADFSIIAGDCLDADYFIYAENNSGIIIIGLSDEGKKRAELTVPTSIDEKPVTALGEGFIKESNMLQKICIQGNITSIPDGCFSGCKALKEIHILSDKPENCHVGQGLLKECDADIFVPADSLSAYKVNYFWSQYASRIMKER